MPFDATPVVQPVHTEELAIVDKMIALLKDPKRWCKRHYTNGHQYCLVGALGQVATGDPCCLPADRPHSRAVDHVLRVIDRMVPIGVTLFNDLPDTDHSDVMALLTKVRAQFQ
jgi:hypothetical protein